MADFGSSPQLRRLIEKLKQAATPGSKLREDFARVVGAAATKKLADEFMQSKDPYGNPWAKLSHPSRRRGGTSAQPLLDTGRLRASFSVQPNGSGFELSTRTTYAAPHQYGATIKPRQVAGRAQPIDRRGRFIGKGSRGAYGKRRGAVAIRLLSAHAHGGGTIPRRQMVPEADTGGLGSWGDAMNRAAGKFLRDIFEGK